MRPLRSELARTALRPASALWGLVAGAKNTLYDRRWARVFRLPVPVVSVGNITAGGTGKTPLIIHLARFLLSSGFSPLVLSRGYGSKGTGSRIVSDGRDVLLSADEAGDEPVLIARSVPGVPVVVDPDRVRGGRVAVRRFNPTVVLLDDGFQHRRLGRDLDIVLLDAVDPFGRYALLPSGLLREPFRGLGRAGVFIVTHAPRSEELETLTAVVRRYNERAPILRARHVAEMLVPLGGGSLSALARLSSQPVYAFCGIGNPDGFRVTLHEAGALLAGFEAFSDHHSYGRGEIEAIATAARRAGAALVVTTEKDSVRIGSAPSEPPFYALRIRMLLEPESALTDRLLAVMYPGRPVPAESG